MKTNKIQLIETNVALCVCGGWKAVLRTVFRRGGYYIAFLVLTLEGGREAYLSLWPPMSKEGKVERCRPDLIPNIDNRQHITR